MSKLENLVLEALDDLKAKDVVEMDVSSMSDVMDHLIVASGTSNRHVKSLASHVASEAKSAGFMPLGVEGEGSSEWVLVDFGDIVVHVMTPATRSFYDLEKLWLEAPKTRFNQDD